MDEKTSYEPSAFGSRKFIAAAVFFALVIVAGVVVTLMGRDSSSQAPTPSTPNASSPSHEIEPEQPTPTRNGHDSVCGLTDADQSIPHTGLNTKSVVVGNNLVVPYIDGVGPGITDGISHCFAQSPRGAILAAANFMTWLSSQQRLPDVMDELFLLDERSETMLNEAKAEWDGSSSSPLIIRGYSYEYISDDHALVSLAVTAPEESVRMVSFSLALFWRDGDWKVEAPANQSWGDRLIDSFILEGFSHLEMQ